MTEKTELKKEQLSVSFEFIESVRFSLLGLHAQTSNIDRLISELSGNSCQAVRFSRAYEAKKDLDTLIDNISYLAKILESKIND